MTFTSFITLCSCLVIVAGPCLAEDTTKIILPTSSITTTVPSGKPAPFLQSAPSPVLLESMTWQEVRDAIKAGKTTVIIPTGGTEQNGPHIALGKHNFVLQYTTLIIAQRLGNTMIAPILPYVPEGDIHPPTGHMKFAGTLSLRPETFAAVLEDTARSLKEHGFKTICFVGEHGASQPVQQQVAEKLSAEWKSEHVKVIQVNDYYDPERNGQIKWLHDMGSKEANPEAHAGLADTAEVMSLTGVFHYILRENLKKPYTAADADTLGVAGSGMEATYPMGAKLLDLKIQGAVNQIKKEREQ